MDAQPFLCGSNKFCAKCLLLLQHFLVKGSTKHNGCPLHVLLQKELNHYYPTSVPKSCRHKTTFVTRGALATGSPDPVLLVSTSRDDDAPNWVCFHSRLTDSPELFSLVPLLLLLHHNGRSHRSSAHHSPLTTIAHYAKDIVLAVAASSWSFLTIWSQFLLPAVILRPTSI
jgi:hypothetical protein